MLGVLSPRNMRVTWLPILRLDRFLASTESRSTETRFIITTAPSAYTAASKDNLKTDTAVGPYEMISDTAMGDDFALDRFGVGYLDSLIDNVVNMVYSNGTQCFIAGAQNFTEVAGGTAAALGRTKSDKNVLYVTTGGAWGVLVLETRFEGGKIMAIAPPF